MSWCRWGSKCTNTATKAAREFCGLPVEPDENDACPDETCPGSDLYIVEELYRLICYCGVDEDGCFQISDPYVDKNLTLSREAAKLMAGHVLAHDASGDHVRKSILAWARETLNGSGQQPSASSS